MDLVNIVSGQYSEEKRVMFVMGFELLFRFRTKETRRREYATTDQTICRNDQRVCHHGSYNMVITWVVINLELGIT